MWLFKLERPSYHNYHLSGAIDINATQRVTKIQATLTGSAYSITFSLVTTLNRLSQTQKPRKTNFEELEFARLTFNLHRSCRFKMNFSRKEFNQIFCPENISHISSKFISNSQKRSVFAMIYGFVLETNSLALPGISFFLHCIIHLVIASHSGYQIGNILPSILKENFEK